MFDNVTPVSDYEHSLKLRHFLQENQTLSRVLSTSGKKKRLSKKIRQSLFLFDFFLEKVGYIIDI